MGRPKIPIDANVIEGMARVSCTTAEMASILGVGRRTIEDRFRREIEKGRASARMSLRHMQWKKALEGNIVMMIWLGKNELGQTDRAAIELSGQVDAQVLVGHVAAVLKVIEETPEYVVFARDRATPDESGVLRLLCEPRAVEAGTALEPDRHAPVIGGNGEAVTPPPTGSNGQDNGSAAGGNGSAH